MDKNERDARTIQLTGVEGIEKLRTASVLVVGVGGVGSYAAEAVARAGIGTVAVMDGDTVSVSNMNRQLVALASTVGRNKADVMAERIKDINPEAEVIAIPCFYGCTDTGGDVSPVAQMCQKNRPRDTQMLNTFDWIIDAIDDVDAKVQLIKNSQETGVNIVSAMGAAGKFETYFKTADISKTSMCPLAKVMRRRLRAEGIEHLPVVYSEEKPVPRDGELGSMSYVPGAMGLELAGYVIKQILNS